MTTERLRVGKLGEEEAERRLRRSGCEILARNWRCRSGEIDIVAKSGDCIVFVEVRSRSKASGSRFGTAAESVDYRKQAKVRLVAQMYLRQNRMLEARTRFDVISVTLGVHYVVDDYRHYESAF
jgi:putative endonuclease